MLCFRHRPLPQRDTTQHCPFPVPPSLPRRRRNIDPPNKSDLTRRNDATRTRWSASLMNQ
jgi:hypothetical protein